MDSLPGSDVLARLRQERPYPAVSLLMPTHRREPENAQDPVRLRNLIARAREQLAADPAVTRERRTEVESRLEQALQDVDLAHAEDGLVIFVAPGEHHVWSVPREVPERVVLSDTFLTRNLAAARAAVRPFWALTVAADRVCLWSGDDRRTGEHTGDGFPLVRSLEDPDAERKERFGDLPSTFRDEQTRQFLRQAHEALRTVVDSAPRPLYLIGEAAALALMEEFGPLARDTTTIRRGGLGAGPAAQVQRVLEPVQAERAKAEHAAALAALETARGQKQFAGGLDEVAEAAFDGRIRLLVVEEHFKTVVRDYLDHLEPAVPTDLDAREDIVDEIVEQALETGAEVHFVPDDALSAAGRIAGVLRY
ncbi:chemotaxis protein [Streptomyces indicus]|uniref:Peptide chain release factor 1 (ERF1) n=1 Tax=Streptomyces indicus TaxID=417292 RepID=A0A1G9J0E8_9ACTN|nr:chemotaxis protein [Streptomyces indicus]SDL30949.1 Peptide chain release factor 1 (eRF1) [Streptomyces indicus]